MLSDLIEVMDRIDMPVFVLSVADDGAPRYAAFSVKGLEVAGLRLADIVGQTAKIVYPGRFGQYAYDRHCEVIRRRQTCTYELELILGSGLRWIRTTLAPVLDADGKVCKLVGTSTDITEEYRARELETSYCSMRSDIEQFVALAAHDLRAPMRNVRTIAEMLRSDLPPGNADALSLIDELETVAAKSMLLIGDVLAYAQASAARPSDTAFDFHELCNDICAVLDPQQKHRISWFEARLFADRTAFQIILRNLIDNAIKHSGKDCVTIEIRPGVITKDMVEVVLCDDGPGFTNPSAVFRAQNTFQAGGGYGLWGVRRLVHSRHGSISATRRDSGSGAVVRFSLPAASTAEIETTTQAMGEIPVLSTPPRQIHV